MLAWVICECVCLLCLLLTRGVSTDIYFLFTSLAVGAAEEISHFNPSNKWLFIYNHQIMYEKR